MQTTTILEGETSLVVPALSEPKMIPAFFNPKGKLVRDVSIVCYKAFADAIDRSDLTFVDALTGTGARGIRVAKEVKTCSKIFLNDVNSAALGIASESAEINGIKEKCVFSKSEACAFLLSRTENAGERFDIVEIDPFGTPSDYVDCAIKACKDGGLVSLTATDSAVLCGVYPKVALRKYLGFPLRTDYCHEVGMRLIFGLLAQTAMRLETGIRPLFCHHDMHYFRVYCQVKVGNNYSRENEAEIGFVLHCFKCGKRSLIGRDEFFSTSTSISKRERASLSATLTCPNCGPGSRFAVGGPCWIGKIQSTDFVKKCAAASESQLFSEELDLPLYYDLTTISQGLGTRTPRITDTIEALRGLGFTASRTRLNPKAVRTEAPIDQLRGVVERLGR